MSHRVVIVSVVRLWAARSFIVEFAGFFHILSIKNTLHPRTNRFIGWQFAAGSTFPWGLW